MSKLEYRAYWIITGSVALWCVLIVIPPLIAHLEEPSQEISRSFYQCYSTVCHQYEARSLSIFGHKLAVCSRCNGIYFGALLGTLLYPFVRFRKQWSVRTLWIISILPMVVDVFLNGFGVYASSITTRLATGAFFGVGGAGILLRFAIEAVVNILSSLTHHQGAPNESKT